MKSNETLAQRNRRINQDRANKASQAQAAALQKALASAQSSSSNNKHYNGKAVGSYDPLGTKARNQAASSYRAGRPSSLKEVKIPNAPKHIQDYVRMMINTHDSEPVQAPSPVPFRSAPARQVLAADVSDNYCLVGATPQFYGEVQPNLNNTLLLTCPASKYGLASNATIYVGDFTCLATPTPNNPISSGYMNTTLNNTVMVAGTIASGGVDTKIMGFPLDVTVGTMTVTAVINSQSPFDEPITVAVQTCVGGIWSSLGSGTLTPDGSVTIAGLVFPLNCQAVTFALTSNPTADRELIQCSFSLTRTAGTGAWLLGAVPKHCVAYETTILQSVSQLQYARITALDVLGTFQGATMTDGGTVAIARVPKYWSSQSANGYTEILLLPYDSYDGELKHGFHGHWVPTCLDDISPATQINNFASFGATKIVFGGSVNTAGQSVRVRASIVVEYFSTAPSYGVMTYTPPPNDMAMALYYVATQIPACTSNKEHIVRKLGNLGSKYLGQALAYLKQHPELLFEVGSSIATALL